MIAFVLALVMRTRPEALLVIWHLKFQICSVETCLIMESVTLSNTYSNNTFLVRYGEIVWQCTINQSYVTKKSLSSLQSKLARMSKDFKGVLEVRTEVNIMNFCLSNATRYNVPYWGLSLKPLKDLFFSSYTKFLIWIKLGCSSWWEGSI